MAVASRVRAGRPISGSVVCTRACGTAPSAGIRSRPSSPCALGAGNPGARHGQRERDRRSATRLGLTGSHGRPVGVQDGAATLTSGDEITPLGAPPAVSSWPAERPAYRASVQDLVPSRCARSGVRRARTFAGAGSFASPRRVPSQAHARPVLPASSGRIVDQWLASSCTRRPTTRVSVPGDPDYPSVSNGYEQRQPPGS